MIISLHWKHPEAENVTKGGSSRKHRKLDHQRKSSTDRNVNLDVYNHTFRIPGRTMSTVQHMSGQTIASSGLK